MLFCLHHFWLNLFFRLFNHHHFFSLWFLSILFHRFFINRRHHWSFFVNRRLFLGFSLFGGSFFFRNILGRRDLNNNNKLSRSFSFYVLFIDGSIKICLGSGAFGLRRRLSISIVIIVLIISTFIIIVAAGLFVSINITLFKLINDRSKASTYLFNIGFGMSYFLLFWLFWLQAEPVRFFLSFNALLLVLSLILSCMVRLIF